MLELSQVGWMASCGSVARAVEVLGPARPASVVEEPDRMPVLASLPRAQLTRALVRLVMFTFVSFFLPGLVKTSCGCPGLVWC